jgi:glycosyltransferase involved in cell wall biosynthesis
MRVAVDGRTLRPGAARARGVARYLRCLLEELRRLSPEDEYELVDPGRAGQATAALVGRPRLDRLAGGCDVAWLPAPAPVAISRGTPYVLTVHDLSFVHRARDYPLYDRLWQGLARPARLARDANRVLCVSDATRRAAIEEWRIEEDRARTVLSGPGRARAALVPSGAAAAAPGGAQTGPDAAAPRGLPTAPHTAASGDPPTGPDAAEPAGPPTDPDPSTRAGLPAELPETFFLAVGALEPRKLPGVLAEAHRRALSEGLRAGLVFAGDGRLRGELVERGATVLGHVPDATLDALYERALAVVCASREEGFGFTPLEAASLGTPSVVTDLQVFSETLGEGALRVPPGDPDSLARELLRLERDPGLRERLASAAREAAGRLSWERAARETRSALMEAHSKGLTP